MSTETAFYPRLEALTDRLEIAAAAAINVWVEVACRRESQRLRDWVEQAEEERHHDSPRRGLDHDVVEHVQHGARRRVVIAPRFFPRACLRTPCSSRATPSLIPCTPSSTGQASRPPWPACSRRRMA